MAPTLLKRIFGFCRQCRVQNDFHCGTMVWLDYYDTMTPEDVSFASDIALADARHIGFGGDTIIHQAVLSGREENVRLAAALVPDYLHEKNQQGLTPKAMAEEIGNMFLVRFLCDWKRAHSALLMKKSRAYRRL